MDLNQVEQEVVEGVPEIDNQLEQVTNLAETAALEAQSQAQNVEESNKIIEQLQQQLAEKDGLIKNLSSQNLVKAFEEMDEPVLNTEELSFLDETQTKAKIDEFIENKMKYQENLQKKSDYERDSFFSNLEEQFSGIKSFIPELDKIIEKTPSLKNAQNLEDKYIPAFLMLQGVDKLNAKETPKQTQYEQMMQDKDFMAFLEQQKLTQAKNTGAETPPMGTGTNIAPNIPQKPKTFDELRKRWGE